MNPSTLKSKLESDAYFYTSDEGKKLVQLSQETYEEVKEFLEKCRIFWPERFEEGK
jgi:hypothetical protein